MTILWITSFIALIFTLAYQRASIIVWTIAAGLYLLILTQLTSVSSIFLAFYWGLYLLIAIPFNFPKLRQPLLSAKILHLYRHFLPKMSITEKEALSAGTVGWEKELFSGAPNWEKLHAYAVNILTEEERTFINGPVQELCNQLNDWEITYERNDLSPEIWELLKENGFWGLIIPKEYGGKGFSAFAHSLILQKLYSRSATVAITVAVPNSLGPAELLLHYGTQHQRDYYLPKLARGEEIPCFALTNPEAGSDASSIPDTGIICKGEFNGENIIGIRLNWNKRYITLAPIATVIGLAFKLYDPERLIGEHEEIGITCALIPTTTPGVMIGNRHFPLNLSFQNGPTQGKDVFIPLDWIIGGEAMAGRGWQMLMECLSAGRAISLPSGAVGGAKALALACGAYAHIRKQFKLPIGNFEGIAEILSPIAGYTYIMDAGLQLGLSAIDKGERPAIVSAILKHYTTERYRNLCNNAMDIHGGKGICLGPKNYLGRYYQGIPISITVEGANILTRNIIIFGQGALRCHPYLLSELEAAYEPDPLLSLKKFDTAFWGHVGYIFSNIIRTFLLSLTNGKISFFPYSPAKKYYQQATRYSAAFALVADITLLLLGGKIKRKERLSARLADILSLLYLSSATLKRYADNQYSPEEKPLADWSCQTLFNQIENSFDRIFKNFPNRWIALFLRCLILPFGKKANLPSDQADQELAHLLMKPSTIRNYLTSGVDTAPSLHNNIGKMELILEDMLRAEPLYQKVHTFITKPYETFDDLVSKGLKNALLTPDEAMLLQRAETGRKEVIGVDEFEK